MRSSKCQKAGSQESLPHASKGETCGQLCTCARIHADTDTHTHTPCSFRIETGTLLVVDSSNSNSTSTRIQINKCAGKQVCWCNTYTDKQVCW